MSSKQNKFRDPAKRAEKRRRQREAATRSAAKAEPTPKPAQSQMTHASSNRAKKLAREGERQMHAERERTDGGSP